jgi:hypothetical protein
VNFSKRGLAVQIESPNQLVTGPSPTSWVFNHWD